MEKQSRNQIIKAVCTSFSISMFVFLPFPKFIIYIIFGLVISFITYQLFRYVEYIKIESDICDKIIENWKKAENAQKESLEILENLRLKRKHDPSWNQ